MNEMITLFHVGSLPVTAFALCMALGALLGCALTVWLGRKSLPMDARLSLCLAVIPCAAIGARVMYCVMNIQYILIDLGGPAFLYQPWEGGYTLWGGVLGGMLGAWLYARATRRSVRQTLDLCAPGAALALMFIRLGEVFTSQGLGKLIETEAFQRFPFAVQDSWGDWLMPVFFYEAVAALVMLLVSLRLLKKNGRAAETFLCLLGVTQILLESWRMDEYIRFGFVRVNQLASAVFLAAVLAVRVVRVVRAGSPKLWTAARIVLFLLGVGVIIAIEFALDKSPIDNRLLYVVMALTLAVMGTAVLEQGRLKG